MIEPNAFINGDCMEYLHEYPDNYFDLAVVDPPYGDGGGYDSSGRFGGRFDRYKTPPTTNPSSNGGGRHYTCGARKKQRTYADRRNMGGEVRKKIIAWDVAPPKEYFAELFRVSRNQIIWGGNYFNLPPTRCFLVWRKLSITEDFSMAMAEYAWTSFNGNAKVFECAPQGTAAESRFHPTQKPLRLYNWIMGRYTKPGMRILDTHAGSAGSLIAAHEAGCQYVGFEIDPDYYKKAKARLEAAEAQQNIFDYL